MDRIQNNKLRYKCKMCEEKFMNKQLFWKHLKLKHEEDVVVLV